MAPWMSPGYWSPNMRSLEEQLQQELEGHRKTWRQLEHVNGLLREIRRHNSSGLTKEMQNRIDAALSQQAEPVEPAAAQDEQEAFEQHYHRFDLSRDPVSGAYLDSEVRCLWDAWQARATRRARSEQQPEVRQIKKPPFGLPYGTSGKEVP